MLLADEHRAFIARILKLTGWNQTELAQRSGLDPSTLSRFLSAGRSGHALRPSTIAKVETATGISFAPRQPTVEEPAGFAEPEAIPLTLPDEGPLRRFIEALGPGRGNVDPWTLQSRALEHAGYRPGDILLVALGETPVQGDIVCAQIYDWTKGRAETVFRLFQPPYLVATTSDSSLMRPYLVDDGTVTIKGVVLHMLRQRMIPE